MGWVREPRKGGETLRNLRHKEAWTALALGTKRSLVTGNTSRAVSGGDSQRPFTKFGEWRWSEIRACLSCMR